MHLRLTAFRSGEISLCGVWSRSSIAHGAAHLGNADDHKQGFCSTYGICGHRKDKDVLNCVNSTEAQPVASDVARKLQDVCPQLYKEAGEQDGKYCCSEEQIDVLSRQVKNAIICILAKQQQYRMHPCIAMEEHYQMHFCIVTQ
jgi:hypothetical protein